MGIVEELFAAQGDAEKIAKVSDRIEATAEDFKARVRAEIVRVIAVMDAADLDDLSTAIAARRAQLRDPAEEARRIDAFRRAAMEAAREAMSAGEILGTDATMFYAIEAEARLTGQSVYAVAAGNPAAEEALEEIAWRRARTHLMRDWLHNNWLRVSDRAATILAVEGIGRA